MQASNHELMVWSIYVTNINNKLGILDMPCEQQRHWEGGMKNKLQWPLRTCFLELPFYVLFYITSIYIAARGGSVNDFPFATKSANNFGGIIPTFLGWKEITGWKVCLLNDPSAKNIFSPLSSQILCLVCSAVTVSVLSVEISLIAHDRISFMGLMKLLAYGWCLKRWSHQWMQWTADWIIAYESNRKVHSPKSFFFSEVWTLAQINA